MWFTGPDRTYKRSLTGNYDSRGSAGVYSSLSLFLSLHRRVALRNDRRPFFSIDLAHESGRDADTWERIDIYLARCAVHLKRACCVRLRDRLTRSDLEPQLRAVRDHALATKEESKIIAGGSDLSLSK